MRRVFLLCGPAAAHSVRAYITQGCRYIIARDAYRRCSAESIHDAPKQIACERRTTRAGEVTVAAGRQTKSFVDLDDDI